MSALTYVNDIILPAALSMLPAKMSSVEARAFLLAIGLQESGFIHRRQMEGGPARGFFGFEFSGVIGVFRHEASRPHIANVLREMSYEGSVVAHEALADNDVLACVYARLLLWTHPPQLPGRDNVGGAWNQYIALWRPGKPHRDTWGAFYQRAWEMVNP